MTSTARRPQTSAPSDGSRTITVHEFEQGNGGPEGASGSSGPSVGVLRLRGHASRRQGPRVAWKAEVIDNEGMGKKKSKICCIYHKPKRFDESSDESDTDTESDSSHGRCNHRQHHHSHSPDLPEQAQQPTPSQNVTQVSHESSDEDRNAYERVPKVPEKGKGKS
ncbi:hypothetical protein SISNIDRAFT_117348 [Sistotremastrum niveocremeum HHB9708]|nr:hypothetical protein SISNIDRAFT_117348 [Sistotremastrum niveocremeum HHB9708]